MYIIYTYGSIIAGPNQEDLEYIVADLKKSNFGVTMEVTLEDF